MIAEKSKSQETEISIERKLQALFELQKVDSEIDKIKILRGELPLEVQDLEDEIEGLETRLKNLEDEIKALDASINAKKADIDTSQGLIKKYQDQQNNVRNNREFDSLSKEVEFQTLEIELCEKRIREFTAQMKIKKDLIDQSKVTLSERDHDLQSKKKVLNDIIGVTQKEEESLLKRSREVESLIEARLMVAYKRIRSNARNGLSVVTVQRDACGGCFNKIPPQRQMEIRSRKKIIVCEYCGRILVDDGLDVEQQ